MPGLALALPCDLAEREVRLVVVAVRVQGSPRGVGQVRPDERAHLKCHGQGGSPTARAADTRAATSRRSCRALTTDTACTGARCDLVGVKWASRCDVHAAPSAAISGRPGIVLGAGTGVVRAAASGIARRGAAAAGVAAGHLGRAIAALGLAAIGDFRTACAGLVRAGLTGW